MEMDNTLMQTKLLLLWRRMIMTKQNFVKKQISCTLKIMPQFIHNEIG